MKLLLQYSLLAFLVIAAHATYGQQQSIRVERVDFKAPNGLQILGELRLPQSDSKPPMVIVLPSKGGIDGTGEQYIRALNARGISTLELNPLAEKDLLKVLAMSKAAMGISVRDYGVDQNRLGIMGFSMGAMVSLMATSERWMTDMVRQVPFRFKAHVALYPPCAMLFDANDAPYMNWHTMRPSSGGKENGWKGMFDHTTGAKVLVLVGENEDYEDAPAECPKLISVVNASHPSSASLTVYPFAGHGWDVPTSRTYTDTSSRKNNPIQHTRYEKTYEKSLSTTVDFFEKEFAR